MKWIDSLKRRVTSLLVAPGEELSSWARLARFQIQFWRFCARRLRESNAMAMSAALSFRTIFAMVPVLILIFLAFRAIGMEGRGKAIVHDLLADSELSEMSFVRDSDSLGTRPAPWPEAATRTAPATLPADGNAPITTVPADGDRVSVADEIERLVERVEKKLSAEALGPIGGILLIWSALTLLTTVERSLNRVFEAPRSRSLATRILIYWSLLTLGPVVMFGAWYVAGQAAEAVEAVPILSWVIGLTSWIGPAIVSILVVAGVYKLMPNTRVSFRAAAGGASLAVPLWLLFRWAFAAYVANVGVTNIYGAIGIVPLFLLWLNLSWWIFLFGAQLAHSAANAARGDLTPGAERRMLGPWDMLAGAVVIGRGHLVGESPVPLEHVSEQLNMSLDFTKRICDRLCRQRFCAQTAADDHDAAEYVLARSADTIAVLDILEIGEVDELGRSVEGGPPEVSGPVETVRRRAQSGLRDLTLADILED